MYSAEVRAGRQQQYGGADGKPLSTEFWQVARKCGWMRVHVGVDLTGLFDLNAVFYK
ncbi:hypothetical protein CAter282_1914 [Collimonas arenae]|uniref:Uncharacterized protein n=1 Tax=Collimonas arenae TaxID=279058 RepID=A0A127QJB3_9BURK|nr:hypothetical protein CAter10_2065 [Collimonas arenae]AMP09682.1 hypothetical protein CAter282_1914 [Collimonas arenae]